MPFKPEEREYRIMSIAVRASEEENSNFIVEGYATTYNQQYELWSEPGMRFIEQVDPHAFDGCDMSDVIMQYDHHGRVFARLSNGTMKLESDSTGLKVIADLSGTEIGRQLYEEIRGGYTNQMSFGFTIRDKKREIIEAEDGSATVIQTITAVKRLYDVSAVSIPANPNTSIQSLTRSASLDGDIEEVRQELEARREKKIQRERLALRVKLLQEADK